MARFEQQLANTALITQAEVTERQMFVADTAAQAEVALRNAVVVAQQRPMQELSERAARIRVVRRVPLYRSYNFDS